MITRDYPLLRDDQVKLNPERSAPLVLIKATVGKLLESMLKADGFNVLNVILR